MTDDLDAARAIVQSFRYDDHGGYDAGMEWLEQAIAAALRERERTVWEAAAKKCEAPDADWVHLEGQDGIPVVDHLELANWCRQQAQEER